MLLLSMPRETPTLKQEKFCKAYLETGNKVEAAMQVYNPNSRANANAIATQNFQKPVIQKTIKQMQENMQEHVYDVLMRTDALRMAIESAIKDLGDDDRLARDSARKFLDSIANKVKDEGGAVAQHLHLSVPKR